MSRTGTAKQKAKVNGPDIHTQFEEILHAVWEGEANWRFDDRLDLATRAVTVRTVRAPGPTSSGAPA